MVVISSCERNKKIKDSFIEGVFQLEIIKPGGTLWNDRDQFLQMPFNLGVFNGNKVIFLSKAHNEGDIVNVHFIGAVRLIALEVEEIILIAVPYDKSKRTIDVKGFDEFSTVYSSAKWILGQYLINRSTESQAKVKSWENEKYVRNYILNK